MKRLYAMVSMVMEVTEAEYTTIKENMHRGYYDFNSNDDLAKRFQKHGKIDGDCYISEDWCDEED